MNTAHTVTTAGLLKPDRASAGLTSRVIATTPNARRAVTSMGIHSVIKNKTEMDKIERTSMISTVTIIALQWNDEDSRV
jgi:hypothetical protein